MDIEIHENPPQYKPTAKWKPLFDKMKPGNAFYAPARSKGSVLASFRHWQIQDAARLELRLSIRKDKKNPHQVIVYLLRKTPK